MSVEIIDEFPKLVSYLIENYLDAPNMIYRGHTNTEHKLESTFLRYINSNIYFVNLNKIRPADIYNNLIALFLSGLVRIENFNINDYSPKEIFEIARHEGIPSHLIDFTYSPYVALFFAFNGISRNNIYDKEYVSLHCINTKELDKCYTKYLQSTNKTSRHFLSYNDKNKELEGIIKKIYMTDEGIEDGVINIDNLSFISMPSCSNKRMIAQQGCFIEDSLCIVVENKKLFFNSKFSLGSFIDNYGEGFNVLKKIYINKKLKEKIDIWLDTLNINNISLYMSRDAIVNEAKSKAIYEMKKSKQLSEVLKFTNKIKFKPVLPTINL